MLGRDRNLPIRFVALSLFVMTPLLAGAEGGCGSLFSESPAPDMTGAWDVDYEDDLDVTIRLGGAVYTATLGAQGGVVQLDHEGQPLSFDLDCSRPEVICPSEVWPAYVTVRQDDARYPHRIWVRIPQQSCDGDVVPALGSECGPDTLNPDCERICEGAVITTERETFGLIDEAGESFDLLLGAGLATNGINCALLGLSVAEANLLTLGTMEHEDWTAYEMVDAGVTTGYAGGCLWAGDPDDDGTLEALVIGASVELRTGFSGTKR